MIYIDLDASVMRLLKRNSSPADLMHSPISKSDHSGGPSLMNWWTSTNAFIAKTSNGPNIQPKMNSALRFPRGPLIGNHDKNAMRNQIPSGPNFRYQSMG